MDTLRTGEHFILLNFDYKERLYCDPDIASSIMWICVLCRNTLLG